MTDLFHTGVKKPEFKKAMTYSEKYYAKKAFSRFFLGFVLMYLATLVFAEVLVFGIKKLLPLIPADTAESLVKILNDYYVLNFSIYAFMYLFAFPCILFPLVKNLPTWDKRCDGMPKGRILGFFLIFQCTNILLGMLGLWVNDLISGLLGTATEPVFSDVPLWALTILSIIIAPIFEELIFRKVLMDRIGVYGERLAIIVSAISFGAFHGNFQQFFFTVMAGVGLAIIYAKTKKIIYPIILHFLNNAYSVLQQYIYEIDFLNENKLSLFYGWEITLAEIIISLLVYVLFISGAVMLVLAILRGWFSIKNSPDTVYITQKRGRIMLFNLGSLAFVGLTVYMFMTSFLSVGEWFDLIKGLIIKS